MGVGRQVSGQPSKANKPTNEGESVFVSVCVRERERREILYGLKEGRWSRLKKSTTNSCFVYVWCIYILYNSKQRDIFVSKN